MNVSLVPSILDEIVMHSKSVYPQEGCGLLAGRDGTVTRFIPAPNVLMSKTAYEIDPAFLVSAFRRMRETGEELVGIFHSHPDGPAEPSQSDLNRAFYPQAAHVIVSLSDPKCPLVRAFRIIDGSAFEIELHAIV
jgi:proteasome lid subunit RPN8/RPN11